jgi:AraC family transcriptional regulator
MTLLPAAFAYSDQRATFETLLEFESQTFAAERVRTSAGYDRAALETYCLALHLGAPVMIMHERPHGRDLRTYRANDLMFTMAGGDFYYACADTVDALYLYIEPPFFVQTAAAMGLDLAQLDLQDRFGFHDSALSKLARTLLDEMEQERDGGALYMEALVLQISIHLLRSFTPKAAATRQPAPRQLSAAIAYIHEYLGQSMSLSEIAAAEHLTPFHFSRIFKQVYGTSPHQYVIEQRLKRAADLLRGARLSVTDVAMQVGFATPSHLTRHFKRYYGITPQQMQQE